MIDKREEQEAMALEAAKLKNETELLNKQAENDKRVASFANTGAVLTKDDKIILPHASDADFNTDNCYTEYLIYHLYHGGFDKLLANPAKAKEVIEDLLDHVGDDYCQEIVSERFTKKLL